MNSCAWCTLHEKNYPKNDVNEMKTIVRHSAHSPLRSSYFLCFFTSNVIILIFKTELMTSSHFICLLYHTFVLWIFKCSKMCFRNIHLNKLCVFVYFPKCLDLNEQKNEETEINWKETSTHTIILCKRSTENVCK